MPADHISHEARNIVNQLFDIAEVPVATRQALNDRCDEFVRGFFADLQRRLAEAEAQLSEECEKRRKAVEALRAISACYCDSKDYQAEWLAVDKVLSEAAQEGIR